MIPECNSENMTIIFLNPLGCLTYYNSLWMSSSNGEMDFGSKIHLCSSSDQLSWLLPEDYYAI